MRLSSVVSVLTIISTCAGFFSSRQCGPKAGNQVCKDNECCGKYGYCGNTPVYCKPSMGCQPEFGRCNPRNVAPVGTSKGRCGPTARGLICAPGYCCSARGYCGTSAAYCDPRMGCRPRYGTCSVDHTSSTLGLSTPSSGVSRQISSIISKGASASLFSDASMVEPSSTLQSSISIALISTSSSASMIEPSSALQSFSIGLSSGSSIISSIASSSTTSSAPSSTTSSALSRSSDSASMSEFSSTRISTIISSSAPSSASTTVLSTASTSASSSVPTSKFSSAPQDSSIISSSAPSSSSIIVLSSTPSSASSSTLTSISSSVPSSQSSSASQDSNIISSSAPSSTSTTVFSSTLLSVSDTLTSASSNIPISESSRAPQSPSILSSSTPSTNLANASSSTPMSTSSSFISGSLMSEYTMSSESITEREPTSSSQTSSNIPSSDSQSTVAPAASSMTGVSTGSSNTIASAESSSSPSSSPSSTTSSSLSSTILSISTKTASPVFTSSTVLSSVNESPSPSTAASGGNLVLLPTQDLSVNRMSRQNMIPARSVTLFYAERRPGNYTMLIRAKLASEDSAILLENIGAIDAIDCSGSRITASFSDESSAVVARSWPPGTILFTLADGCNPTDQRGVYIITSINSRLIRARASAVKTVEFLVTRTNLQEIVEELDISYGQMISSPSDESLTSYTTTITSYFTNPWASTMTSSVFISTITPSMTSMIYTSSSNSVSSSSSLVVSSTSTASSHSISDSSSHLLFPTDQREPTSTSAFTYSSPHSTVTGSTTLALASGNSSSVKPSPSPTALDSTISSEASLLVSSTSLTSQGSASSSSSIVEPSTFPSNSVPVSRYSSLEVSSTTTGTPTSESLRETSPVSTSSSSSDQALLSSTFTTSSSDSNMASMTSWSLDPSAQAIFNELSAGLPAPGPNGTIDLPIKKGEEPLVTKPLAADPYISDPTYQASLQTILEEDKLDPPETLVSDSTDALGAEGEANITPDGPVKLSVSNYTGTDDSVYDAAINTPVNSTTTSEIKRQIPARAESAHAPRSVAPISGKSIVKRDGWDTFFDIMGDDLVGEICEVCGAIAGGKQLYDAVSCLFGKCPKPPQVTITTLTGTTKQEYKLTSTFPKNGLVFYDSKATVLCADCYIDVSSFKVEGKVVIVAKQLNYPENMVVSAQFTASQSSTASLLFNIRVNGPGAGTFDRVLSTFQLDSVTAPGVVTVSPKFLYGVGMTYDTMQAVDVQAGAVLTYSNAAADLDVKGKTASNPRNWQPTAQVTYPKLNKAGRTVLTPYIKTDIQLSLKIFGADLKNAMVLTTQTNMGFDAQVLTGTEQVTKRDTEDELSNHDPNTLNKRGFINLKKLVSGSLAAALERARQAAIAAGQAPKGVTCNAGSMKLNAVMTTKNQAVLGGKAIELFNQQARFGSQCIPFAAPIVSSSKIPATTIPSSPPPPIMTSSMTSSRILVFTLLSPAPVASSSRISGSMTSSSTTPSSMPSNSINTGSRTSYTTVASSISTSSLFLDSFTSVPSFASPVSSTTSFEATDPTAQLGTATVVSSSAVPTTCKDPAFVPPVGSNCFRVIGHGYPTIEGLYLRKIPGYASPSFDWPGIPPSIFYLDNAGTMYEAGEGTLMATDRTGGGAWMQFTSLQYLGSQPKAICTKDASTKSLSCFQTSTSYLGIAANYPPQDSRRTMPMFGVQPGFTQITMSYEEAICPSLCNKAIATPTSSLVVIPTSYTPCLSPLATEAPAGSVCFTLTGHGPAHVEGQTLGMRSGYASPNLGWSGYTPAVFYKDSNNWIYIASDEQNGQIMSSDSPAETRSTWMEFNQSPTNNLKVTGAFFPEDKTVVFSLGSIVGTVVAPRKDFWSSQDSRSGSPLFSQPDGTWAKLTFTYTEVPCPARCAQAGITSSSVQPRPAVSENPSSIASVQTMTSISSLTAPASISFSLTSPTSITTNPASTLSSVAVTTPTSSSNPQPTAEAENTMAPCDGLSSGTKNFLGFDYNVFCGATGSSPAKEIDIRYLPSFAACINYCTGNGLCKAVMFQEIAPKKNNYKCTRYSALGAPGAGLDWTGSFDVAFRADDSGSIWL